MADQGSDEKRVHEKFSANDSDVTIESADGVLFQLHTQNLKINTGAFPGSEFSTKGEPVKLTENSDVLEVIFACIYPQRHPILEGMEFSLFAKVAEAVEKYEVFPAMNYCAVAMREFLPSHPADVLAHGAKHGYPKLINDAALALCRSPTMSKFTPKFSTPTILAWIEYSESWKDIFRLAISRIRAMGRTTGCCYPEYSQVCDTCRVALLTWVLDMEKITSLPNLKQALIPQAHYNIPGLLYCSEKGRGCSPNGKCSLLGIVAKVIDDGVAKIPPFEQFLTKFL